MWHHVINISSYGDSEKNLRVNSIFRLVCCDCPEMLSLKLTHSSWNPIGLVLHGVIPNLHVLYYHFPLNSTQPNYMYHIPNPIIYRIVPPCWYIYHLCQTGFQGVNYEPSCLYTVHPCESLEAFSLVCHLFPSYQFKMTQNGHKEFMSKMLHFCK